MSLEVRFLNDAIAFGVGEAWSRGLSSSLRASVFRLPNHSAPRRTSMVSVKRALT